MGYKKSFNLVTIQLIIPLSTMTKAEYKNAYGIDLDDIDIERVTLLQEDGSKNKYFVDEVKTTESGFDIYAGGNILSIGSSVSVTKNAYSVDNAKPIYWHGLTFFVTGDSTVLAFAHILNNTDAKLDDITKLKAWFENIEGEVIMPLSGNIKVSNVVYNVMSIIKRDGGRYDLLYKNASGERTDIYSVEISDYYSSCNDSVNKIN